MFSGMYRNKSMVGFFFFKLYYYFIKESIFMTVTKPDRVNSDEFWR